MLSLVECTNRDLILVLTAGISLAFVGSTIYSVYFGRLAKFPGPKLAAATLCYEFYYDIVCDGRYSWKIRELHKQYGPIIRISPYELHIDDPDYYEKLYSTTEPRDKYHWLVDSFGLPRTTFATVDHRTHRMRRAAISPFFSKASINKLEPMLEHMTEKMCSRVNEFRDSAQPINMRNLYQCFTTDVITLYALNRSWNYLDSPDLAAHWVETMRSVVKFGAVVKFFPWLLALVEALPVNVVRKLDPGTSLVLDYRQKIRENAKSVMDGTFKHATDEKGLSPDKTVIQEVLESDLPPAEKEFDRIWREIQVFIAAGTETTANTLSVTHFYLLNDPEVRRKLTSELEQALPDKYAPVSLSVVEKLPYLNAVTQEGLRLSYGVVGRLQRLHPTESMTYREWTIPPKTPVGMTCLHIHENPTIFPEPFTFRPERWLEKRPEGAPSLDRYIVAFSKGSRICLGINLARAELVMALATLFRRFDEQSLFETTELDVKVKHDYLTPQPDARSRGVRVLFS